MREAERRIPVTIVTGFLGAGKTTFLRRLLQESEEKAAVIVNEFGEIGIDGQLIERTEEKIVEINSGCICCNVRKDLIDALSMLSYSREENMVDFDRVIIETTGIADPAPVIQTFLMEETLAEDYTIDAVCTIVDARHIPRHLDEQEEAVSQIAFADVVLVNKTDLVTKKQLAALRDRLERINTTAQWHECEQSRIPLDSVQNIHTFRLSEKMEAVLQLPHVSSPHDDSVFSISLREERPLNLKKLNLWLSFLVQIQGESLYRYKGVFNVEGEEKRLVFQGVHMLLNAGEGKEWGSSERSSEMVFIGKNLNRESLQEQLEQCAVD
ncbi:MAG: GTP-binding protein [Alkalicoccus sp.]|nr:MAG: GTP-binding protein [Alkalicoccus sp.]